MLKKIVLFSSLPLLLLLSTTGCHHTAEPVATPFYMSDTMMVQCQFAEAGEKDVKDELKLFGKVKAANDRQAQVYSIVGGNVTDINVELGDFVKQGQVLATVRSIEVADFERQRLDAQSDLALAEKNQQVAKDLYEGKLNSEKDVTAAEKELEKAKAELRRINEVYNIYNLKNGSSYNITAPIAGFVVSKNITQNEQLPNNNTEVLFSIAQIDEVWVMANVNETDISKVTPGYEAQVQTISYPNKIFEGKVDRIFNAIDPSTKAMKILVKLQNKDRLLIPEMSATITLHYTENKQMVAVPSSSIIFDKGKNWVMVFKDRSHVETVQVDIYSQLGDTTYIQRGLNSGDKIISKNGLLIYDELND